MPFILQRYSIEKTAKALHVHHTAIYNDVPDAI